MKHLAIIAGFNTISWWLVIVAYFLGHPVGVNLETADSSAFDGYYNV